MHKGFPLGFWASGLRGSGSDFVVLKAGRFRTVGLENCGSVVLKEFALQGLVHGRPRPLKP